MQVFTGGLLGLHCLILSKNQTTQEYLNGRGKGLNYSFKKGGCSRILKLLLCLKGRKKEYSLISNDFIRVSRMLEHLKNQTQGANTLDSDQSLMQQSLLQETVRGNLKITSIEDYGQLLPENDASVVKRVRNKRRSNLA